MPHTKVSSVTTNLALACSFQIERCAHSNVLLTAFDQRDVALVRFAAWKFQTLPYHVTVSPSKARRIARRLQTTFLSV